jgi:hypothetical protein
MPSTNVDVVAMAAGGKPASGAPYVRVLDVENAPALAGVFAAKKLFFEIGAENPLPESELGLSRSDRSALN